MSIILNFEEVAAQAAKEGYSSNYTLEVRTFRSNGCDNEGIFFILDGKKGAQYFALTGASVSGLINQADKAVSIAKAAIDNINGCRIEPNVYSYDKWGNISGATSNPLFDATADDAAAVLIKEIKAEIDAAYVVKWCESVAVLCANLTQHKSSAEQVGDGVVDVDFPELAGLLTFDEIPSKVTMRTRATKIARFASQSGFKTAMIGGAPFFMSTLEKALIDAGIKPVYAFSVRDSIEKDGIKTSVFRHIGFVEGE
jgi:hypothetical protein